jgi:hypothetical protein
LELLLEARIISRVASVTSVRRRRSVKLRTEASITSKAVAKELFGAFLGAFCIPQKSSSGIALFAVGIAWFATVPKAVTEPAPERAPEERGTEVLWRANIKPPIASNRAASTKAT